MVVTVILVVMISDADSTADGGAMQLIVVDERYRAVVMMDAEANEALKRQPRSAF